VKKSGAAALKRMELADLSLEIDEARKRKSKTTENTYHRVRRGKRRGGHEDGSDMERIGTNGEIEQSWI
jgi:hypothetical protein